MRTSWFLKFSESSLFFLAITNILMILLEIIPREIAMEFFEISEGISILLLFIFGLIYASLWHRQEKNDRKFPVRHIWLCGIIRYWLSFSIAS